MGWIAEVEDALIARLQTALAARVLVIDSQPGPWTLETLKRVVQTAPGLYVAYLGHRRAPDIAPTYGVARFDVYVVSKNARGDLARRRGDVTAIGAYEMAETVTSVLNQFDIPSRGYMQFVELRNLFQDAMLDLGGTVYAVGFEIALDVAPYPEAPVLDRLKQIFTTTDMDLSQDEEPVAEQLIVFADTEIPPEALLDPDGEPLVDPDGEFILGAAI